MEPRCVELRRVHAERELHEPAQDGGEHQPDGTAMQPTGDRSVLDDILASAGARWRLGADRDVTAHVSECSNREPPDADECADGRL